MTICDILSAVSLSSPVYKIPKNQQHWVGQKPDTPIPSPKRTALHQQDVPQEPQKRRVSRHFFPPSMDIQAVLKQRSQRGYMDGVTVSVERRTVYMQDTPTLQEVREAHEEEVEEEHRNTEIQKAVKDYFNSRTRESEEVRKAKEQEDFYREINRFFSQPKESKKVEHIIRVVYTTAPPLTKEEQKAASCCVIL
jgi:hypothetical protein